MGAFRSDERQRQFLFHPHLGEVDEDSSKMSVGGPFAQVDEEAANLVSSQASEDGRWHMPVIDLDLPARLVPSETPGHHHLFIDVSLTWDAYANLLLALADAGIVESGYVDASIERGFTAVATKPWKKLRKAG